VTIELLTAILAEKLMGWRVCHHRFLTDDCQWLPRHKSQPTKKLDNAFQLLNAAEPVEYRLGGSNRTGDCWARVKLNGAAGEATSHSMPLAICLAIARPLGIEVVDLG
jgi:hypothetical protein